MEWTGISLRENGASLSKTFPSRKGERVEPWKGKKKRIGFCTSFFIRRPGTLVLKNTKDIGTRH